MKCPCGADLTRVVAVAHRDGRTRISEKIQTLVGYYSPPGHNHDDNCLKRLYVCASGHDVQVAIRRRCKAAGCAWEGKTMCSCHEGEKVEEWPEAEMVVRETVG